MKKRITLFEKEYRFGDVRQELWDIDDKKELYGVSDLSECPEDAIIGRALLSGDEVLDLIHNNVANESNQTADNDLNNKINAADIHTAGWMPGKIWKGTVFEPILNKACKGNQTQAGLFFGIIVFKVFMDRPEKWICGRFEKDGKDIGSITYFRPTKP